VSKIWHAMQAQPNMRFTCESTAHRLAGHFADRADFIARSALSSNAIPAVLRIIGLVFLCLRGGWRSLSALTRRHPEARTADLIQRRARRYSRIDQRRIVRAASGQRRAAYYFFFVAGKCRIGRSGWNHGLYLTSIFIFRLHASLLGWQ
jgi:hypothetical protein